MAYSIGIWKVNEENIGALFFLFQAATAFAGEMLNINAFDQPGVEEGKIATLFVAFSKPFTASKP